MELFIYKLKVIFSSITSPPLIFVLIILGIVLHQKNKKTVIRQKMILGDSVNSSIELTLSQVIFGIIIGCIGSIILISFDIPFNEKSGITYLFLISIGLMFIKPRMICFSYSGAILGGICIFAKIINLSMPELLTNEVLNINVLYLMMFIGIFHIIEGFLVMFDGDRGAVPILKEKDGKILGGYAFKRYWPLPITINLISMLPMCAMLGYSTVTFTQTKKEKVISSGIHILTYGLILTIVAQIARTGILGEMITVIFAPLAHEFMLRIQRKKEEKRSPKFISDEEGLVILEIASNSKVKDLGINIGSKVLSVNSIKINSSEEVNSILKKNLCDVILKIKDLKGNIKEIRIKNDNSELGILLVPRNANNSDAANDNNATFKNILNSLKNSKEKELSNDKDGKDINKAHE